MRYASRPVEVDATGAVIVPVPAGRKAVLRKIMVYNPDTADHTILVGFIEAGNPETFTQILPGIRIASSNTIVLGEHEVPGVEVYSTAEKPRAIYAKTGENVSSAKPQVVVEVEWR